MVLDAYGHFGLPRPIEATRLTPKFGAAGLTEMGQRAHPAVDEIGLQGDRIEKYGALGAGLSPTSGAAGLTEMEHCLVDEIGVQAERREKYGAWGTGLSPTSLAAGLSPMFGATGLRLAPGEAGSTRAV